MGSLYKGEVIIKKKEWITIRLTGQFLQLHRTSPTLNEYLKDEWMRAGMTWKDGMFTGMEWHGMRKSALWLHNRIKLNEYFKSDPLGFTTLPSKPEIRSLNVLNEESERKRGWRSEMFTRWDEMICSVVPRDSAELNTYKIMKSQSVREQYSSQSTENNGSRSTFYNILYNISVPCFSSLLSQK